jgi:hypothetical protein
MIAPRNLLLSASARCAAGMAALALLTAHGTWAQDTASNTTVTRITTSRPAEPSPGAQSVGPMQLTAYEGFDRVGTGRGSRRTPLEIDLAVMLAECPDGNVEINAMHIGGWRYGVAGACSDVLNRGVLGVQGITPASASVVARTRPAAGNEKQELLRCDPATWRCDAAP